MIWSAIFQRTAIIMIVLTASDKQAGFAEESQFRMPDPIANTAALCLAKYLARSQASETRQHNQYILTLGSNRYDRRNHDIPDYLKSTGSDENIPDQISDQKLNEPCDSNSEDVILTPRVFRKFGFIDDDQQRFDEFNCEIEWLSQYNDKVILSYLCTSKHHYAPTAQHANWCWKYGDPVGYLAVFSKVGMDIALQGIGSDGGGNMQSLVCTDEADPRHQR